MQHSAYPGSIGARVCALKVHVAMHYRWGLLNVASSLRALEAAPIAASDAEISAGLFRRSTTPKSDYRHQRGCH